MNYAETPVLLLTGYLGSGKTTLLNSILTNRRGIRFAVIVNDIGEVNIDAELIQKGGIVGQKDDDDSLVALQNGCICCTLKMDLVEQLNDIISQKKFDYIVIEASGICEPAPIAQTICSFSNLMPAGQRAGEPKLDCIVSVVDALRMQSEFNCGEELTSRPTDEEDIRNLVIQQIEFCNIILLNKASEVEKHELERIKQILRAMQPKARIIECDYCNIDLDDIVGTGMFDFQDVATSATWITEMEKIDDDDDDDDDICPECGHHHHHHEHEEHEHHHHHEEHEHHDHEHEHHHEHGEECHCGCHHHHHHHDGGEVEEYGIGTYVYRARRPFSLSMFDEFVARRWPKNIIRAKGICYFDTEFDICYLFEQAGKQFSLKNIGMWFATMPREELVEAMDNDEKLRREWDATYGDRMQKIVFIGQNLDKDFIKRELDAALTE